MLFNYTKPDLVTNYSLLQVKDGESTRNLTIPAACWNQDPLQFRVDSTNWMTIQIMPPIPSGQVCWECWNGSGWTATTGEMGCGATSWDSSSVGYQEIYEEAMIWNYYSNITILSPANSTYNTNSIYFNVLIGINFLVDSCLYSLNSGVKNNSMSQSTAFSFDDTNSSMTQGSHTVTFYCNDTSDYIDVANRTFFIDSIYPLISISSPSNHTNTSNTILNINYTYTEINCDSVWWDDGGGANTSLASCGTNITTLNWTEGNHNVTIFMNDTANNVNSSTVYFTIDTINPTVTIDNPKPQFYSTNESLALNYTIIDSGSGVGSCWFKVINSTSDLIIDNTTIANCANTTFNISQGEGTYNLTLYSNDTANNVNSIEVEFGISLTNPAIVLNYPINHQNISSGTDVYFNFTATDTDG